MGELTAINTAYEHHYGILRLVGDASYPALVDDAGVVIEWLPGMMRHLFNRPVQVCVSRGNGQDWLVVQAGPGHRDVSEEGEL